MPCRMLRNVKKYGIANVDKIYNYQACTVCIRVEYSADFESIKI